MKFKLLFTSASIFWVIFFLGCQSTAPTVTEDQKNEMRRRIVDLREDLVIHQTGRVTSIGYRLLQNPSGDPQNNNSVPVLPLLFRSDFVSAASVGPSGLEIATKLSGLGVDNMDIQKGDVLIQGNGRDFQDREQLEELLSFGGKEVDLRLRRDQRQFQVRVPVLYLEKKMKFVMVDMDQPNAFVNFESHTVHVTRSMLDFVESDDELAAILAHEMGHLELNHVLKGTMNNVLAVAAGQAVESVVNAYAPVAQAGALAGDFTTRLTQAPYSQQKEREADEAGLHRFTRAGYDPEKAAQFWIRLAMAFPQVRNGSFLSTHPTPPERLLKIKNRNPIKEIT